MAMTGRERLQQRKKIKILFVCIGNMCRSQMAEGFARSIGGDMVEVYSAGTAPTGMLSPEAVEVMREKGIDISGHYSKGIDEVPLDEMDVVVSMGCCSAGELCPLGFEGKKVDWVVEDPIGKPIEFFRRVRDGIEEKVRSLLDQLWREGIGKVP